MIFCPLLLIPLTQAQSQTIWQVDGGPQSNLNFKLAPNQYSDYSQDGYYVVGDSTAKDIPYVLPGPSDNWAGSTSHDDAFVFNLSQVQPNTQFQVEFKFFDSQDATPPKLNLTLNGKQIMQFQAPKGGGDASINGDLTAGVASDFVAAIPSDVLKSGNNELDLKSVSGSWILLKSVTFYGPNGVKTVPVLPQINFTLLPPEQALRRTQNGTGVQMVNFKYNSTVQTSVAIKVKRDGALTQEASLSIVRGQGTAGIGFSAVDEDTPYEFDVESESGFQKINTVIHPVRPWTIYLMPHAHLDVGYTNPQHVESQVQRQNLLFALEVAKKAAENPIDSQYHYSFEGQWILQQFLKYNTEAQQKQVAKGLQDGILYDSAAEANELTGLMRDEEMMQSYRLGIVTDKHFGVRARVASQTDVPGVTWGDVTALNQAGIKALLLMPNPADRLGDVNRDWQDKPFWWQSEDGQHRVLVWQTVTYGMAHGQRPWNGDRFHIFTTKDPTSHFIGGYLFPRLNELAKNDYPYNIIAIPWSDTDNSPVDGDVPAAAKAWNEKYVYPHVVLATFAQACDALIKEYGKKLPTFNKDYSPYWEDGAGSSARQTSMNRLSADRLVQAEALDAIRGTNGYSPANFFTAWQNVVLYSEHTWGAYNSVSEPNDPTVKEEWARKKKFADDANQQSQGLLARAESSSNSRAIPHEVDVWNTTGWSRSGLVILSAQQSKGLNRAVDASSGKPLPSQRLHDCTLAVWVSKVPALGAVRIKLVKGVPYVAPGERIDVGHNWMKNRWLSLNLDPTTGAIDSLKTNHGSDQLVNGKEEELGQYFYLLGGNIKDRQPNGQPTIKVVDSGPLVAEIEAKSSAPGTSGLIQTYRLTSMTSDLEIGKNLDKTPVLDKESVHIAFPFSVPNGTMRIDLPWSVIIPEKDQLKGANRNWLETNRFVDVSNASRGITVSSLDAPLIEVGGMTANVMGGGYQSSDWIHHLDPSQTFYSWALNNLWYTNYVAEQSGNLTFRYILRPHGARNAVDNYEFGTESTTPLLVTPATRGESLAAPVQITCSGCSVECFKPADDGKGYIVRLWGSSGHEGSVKVTGRNGKVNVYQSDLTEKPLKLIASGKSEVPGYGAVTLLVVPVRS